MLRNGLEPWHIIILVLVVLLVFGGKKLPELARGSGRALRIFKSEVKGMHDDDEAASTPEIEGDSSAKTSQDTAQHAQPVSRDTSTG